MFVCAVPVMNIVMSWKVVKITSYYSIVPEFLCCYSAHLWQSHPDMLLAKSQWVKAFGEGFARLRPCQSMLPQEASGQPQTSTCF